jgi:hypothetical protein
MEGFLMGDFLMGDGLIGDLRGDCRRMTLLLQSYARN